MPLHAARIEKSPRLQRVLEYLQDIRARGNRYGATTRAIIQHANVCAINSCISELRANGYNIECKRADGVFWYRLVEDEV